jgi:hypothetical protein
MSPICCAAIYRGLLCLLDDAEILAFMDFPKECWARFCSTNPIERLNGAIRRRTDVVASSPTMTPSSDWSLHDRCV